MHVHVRCDRSPSRSVTHCCPPLSSDPPEYSAPSYFPPTNLAMRSSSRAWQSVSSRNTNQTCTEWHKLSTALVVCAPAEEVDFFLYVLDLSFFIFFYLFSFSSPFLSTIQFSFHWTFVFLKKTFNIIIVTGSKHLYAVLMLKKLKNDMEENL